MAAPGVRQVRIQLAQQLPPILKGFFKRYPPVPAGAASPLSPDSAIPTPRPSSVTSIAPPVFAVGPSHDPRPSNPFQPWKHPITGLWQNPVYSLRRQADLVKAAREHGVEELLPFTVKGTGVKALKRFEQGLRVKGTGVGQRVKGQLDERHLPQKLELRRRAMVRMPRLIMKWREVRSPI